MDNILENIGDILVINITSEITGGIVLTNYSEELIGITQDRNVSREFRVSANGIFWSDWNVLTSQNLSLNKYITEDLLLIQVRYTRTGTDTTGVIQFNDINFTGTSEAIKLIAPSLMSSILASVLGTSDIKQTEANIFKKLYYRGIIPQYITRAENSDENEDEDYINLFYSIARFFSLIICFGKRFEKFKSDVDLMREQVREFGLYFDENNVSLEQLQYLASHLYDEVRKRGTEMVFSRSGDDLPSGNKVIIDGELIRLLRNKKSDELLYENIPDERTGWCLGKSSPLYRGTCDSINLNKTREKTEDFENLTNFVMNKQGDGNYSLINLDGKKVINLSVSNGICGLGRIDTSQEISSNLYTIDNNLDYEMVFSFRITSGTSAKIKFGAEGFDILKNKLSDSFITPNGDMISEIFFEKELTNIKKNVWYQVRGIIHAYSSSNFNEVKTNLGWGTNLYFNNCFVKYFIPKIQLESTGTSAEVNIWNYKIRPLVRGKNIIPLKNNTEYSHSLGFVQSSRIFYSYFKNNNNNQSSDEITNIINKYLLSFNMTNILILL